MNYPLPDYGYHSVYKIFNSILLMQTSHCPNHCVFCAKSKRGHGTRTMTEKDLLLLMQRIPDFSGYVALAGSGEVCILNDLPDRIYNIKKSWPHCTISITTTLNIYHSDTWIKNLFSAGLDEVRLSLYCHNNDDYKMVYNNDGFSSVCKNIIAIGKLNSTEGKKVNVRVFDNSESHFNIKDAEIKWKKFRNFLSENNIENFTRRKLLYWEPPKPVDGHAAWQLPTPCTVVWGGSNAGLLCILENLDVVPCCMFTDPDYVFGNLRRQNLDEIFNSQNYRHFYETWWAMQPGELPLCNICQLYSANASPQELARMAAWQARELHGKKVIFWGAGEAYRAYKSFFADCEPVAILADGSEDGTNIDGIPLHSPEQFLPTLAEPLPLVIFAMQEASPKILRALKENYPFYRPSKVVICPANAHIEAPVEPFFQD